jgi:hypothetical protein
MTPDTGPNRRLENALRDASAARLIPRADPEVSRTVDLPHRTATHGTAAGQACRGSQSAWLEFAITFRSSFNMAKFSAGVWRDRRHDELVIMWLVKTGTLPTTFLR